MKYEIGMPVSNLKIISKIKWNFTLYKQRDQIKNVRQGMKNRDTLGPLEK